MTFNGLVMSDICCRGTMWHRTSDS